MRLKIIFIIIAPVIIALIHGLPHVLISRMLGEKIYAPLVLGNNVPFYTVDETFAYATRVQESLKNFFFLSDPALYEYKNSYSLYISESLSAKVMAMLSILSGSISNAFVLSDFILPAVSFVLVYLLLFNMTKKFGASLVGGFSVVLGSYLLKTVHFPFSFLLKIKADVLEGTLTPFTRSFHPQVSFIFFILSVLSLYFLLTKRGFGYIFLFGLSLGMLFYTYIYYLIFFLGSLGVIVIMLFGFKDFKNIKRVALSSMIALVIAVPFINTFYHFVNSPLFLNMQKNYLNPLDETFWLSVKIVLTIIIVWVFLRSKKYIFILLESFLLGGLILSNLQFLLDKNLHLSGHLEVRAIYPWIMISVFAVLGHLKFKKIFLYFLAVFLITYGFLTHYSYSAKYFQHYTIEKTSLDLYDWLNNNMKKDSVVMTSSLKENLMILALTSNRIFIPHSFLSFAPSEEIIERIFIANKVLGSKKEKVAMLFEKNEEKTANIKRSRWNFDTCGQWFVYFTRYSNGNYYQCFVPEDISRKIVDDYEKYNLTEESLRKYRFDYLLTDVNKYDIDEKQFIKVYENPDYTLYRFMQ